jgi:hypothetical protein
MAYEGEILDMCGIMNPDFSRLSVVVVSGSGPNVCGHMLLYVESGGGYYLHVATGDQLGGVRGYPRYMTESGYRRYLKENNKREIRRLPVSVADPSGAYLHLERLMSERWNWGVLPNNCVAFAEDVISAGGGTWASASNCPTLSTQATISHRIQEFLYRLEGEIYKAYSVPH